MIRGFLLIVALAAGLGLAALAQGRMHHLRASIPDRLPGWSALVAGDAGLRQGAMTLPAYGRWPETRLIWTARLPSRAGWVWDVTLGGPGIALAGQVVAGFWPDRAILAGVTGTVDLGGLADLPVPIQGIVRVDDLTVVGVGLLVDPVLTAALQAQIPALRLEGADFGAGPLTGVLETEGDWRADLDMQGGVSALRVEIVGRLNDALASVDLAFADSAALPAAMRAMMAAVGRTEGQGWHLQMPLPVR